MTVEEILSQLSCYSSKFPREAIEEAIAQREAITPELLSILEDAIARLPEIASDEDYVGHLSAMFLLAQFREKRAYPLIVEFVSSDPELIEISMGDVITEDLDQILASVCDGDVSLIEGLIENPNAFDFVRSAALGALVVLVVECVRSRDEVIEYFRSLYGGMLESEPDVMWGSLVSESCALYPGELMPQIEKAYADDLVDTFDISMRAVERALAGGKEAALAALAKDPHRRFIEDAAKDMSSFLCRPGSDALPSLTAPIFTPMAAPVRAVPTNAPVRTGPKVGRNEPCPCGSRKKYKKCCGR